MTDQEGLRYNTGKLRVDLIPPEWIEALAIVLTRGANKYAARNWELGMDWSKPMASGKRHMLAWEKGETYDPETGCHHLAMAAWNFLGLMSYQLREVGNNDIPRATFALPVAVAPGEEYVDE